MTELSSLFQSVARVIECATDLPENTITPDNIQQLATLWYNSKTFFRAHLPETFIWESPEIQSFSLPPEERTRKMDKFIESLEYNLSLYRFLNANRSTFYENRVAEDYSFREDYATLTIPKGMKIAKAMRQYFYDNNMEDLISEYSRIIQSDKITGRLCISIHPLDFLSISENTLNWRSCHALDGDYRGGNLNYMCDNVTFITYLKTEESTILPRFPDSVPWNNKKWRALMFLDRPRGVLWSGRHYPFFSSTILDEIQKALVQIGIINYHAAYMSWTSSVINKIQLTTSNYPITLDEDYLYFNGHLARLGRWVSDSPNTYQFNDLLSSSCYKPWMLFCDLPDNHIRLNSLPSMKVGQPAPCPCCGEFNVLTNSRQLICSKCSDKYSYETTS